MRIPRSFRERAWLALPFVAILSCYAPVWLSEYGFGEDYRLLSFYDHGATNRALMIAEGRPIQALWTNLVFGTLTGIESLAMLRLANVALLGIAAVMLALAWRATGEARMDAALAGTAAITLAPFQVFAATAAYGIVPLGAALALAAALCTKAALEGSTRRRGILLGSALLLLLLAITGYQPAAMMYWVVAAILLVAPADELRVFRRKLAFCAAVGFAAVAIGFVIYRAGRAAFPSELAGLDRAALSADPMLKLFWFVLYPLPHALNPWRLHLSRGLALVLGLVVVVGLWLHLGGREGRRQRFFVALALVPLSYLPNLAVAENWSSFRSQIALASIVFVYIVLALNALAVRAGPRLRTAVLAAMTLFGLATAWWNVTRLFVQPQREELAIVRRTLSALPASYTRIGGIPSTESETLAPFSLYDEFGRPSTSFAWGVTDLPYLVLREQRPMADTSDIQVRDARAEGPPPDTLIDWRIILRDARANKTAR